MVRDFFERLDETLTTLQGAAGDTALRIETLPSVAIKWLVPRLQRFSEAHPEAEVWLGTNIFESVLFEGSDADIAIHMSRGSYPGYDSELLMTETVMPVCRPRFLEEHGTPTDPVDLCRFPLLLRYHEILTLTWEFWFRRAGVDEAVYGPALSAGIRFPNSATALQAAFEGQGIALGRGVHVWDDLRSGRLVRLFPEVDSSFELSYYLVSPRGRLARPVVAAFRDWVIDEGRRFEAEVRAAT
ncbi:MAG: LysR substrate-binding domain-containing protein [Rhodospirillaceae bacterium]